MRMPDHHKGHELPIIGDTQDALQVIAHPARECDDACRETLRGSREKQVLQRRSHRHERLVAIELGLDSFHRHPDDDRRVAQRRVPACDLFIVLGTDRLQVLREVDRRLRHDLADLNSHSARGHVIPPRLSVLGRGRDCRSVHDPFKRRTIHLSTLVVTHGMAFVDDFPELHDHMPPSA